MSQAVVIDSENSSFVQKLSKSCSPLVNGQDPGHTAYEPGEHDAQAEFGRGKTNEEAFRSSNSALFAELEHERTLRKQQSEYIEQLQMYYDELLKKHAIAEVTIDQLRVGSAISGLPLDREQHDDPLGAERPQIFNNSHRSLSLFSLPVQRKSSSVDRVSLSHDYYSNRRLTSENILPNNVRLSLDPCISPCDGPNRTQPAHHSSNADFVLPHSLSNGQSVKRESHVIADDLLRSPLIKPRALSQSINFVQESPPIPPNKSVECTLSRRLSRTSLTTDHNPFIADPLVLSNGRGARSDEVIDNDKPQHVELIDEITELQNKISHFLRHKDYTSSVTENDIATAYSQYVKLMKRVSHELLHPIQPCSQKRVSLSMSAHSLSENPEVHSQYSSNGPPKSRDTAFSSSLSPATPNSPSAFEPFAANHTHGSTHDHVSHASPHSRTNHIERLPSANMPSAPDTVFPHIHHTSVRTDDSPNTLQTYPSPISTSHRFRNRAGRMDFTDGDTLRDPQEPRVSINGYQRLVHPVNVQGPFEVRQYEYQMRKYIPKGLHEYYIEQTYRSPV